MGQVQVVLVHHVLVLALTLSVSGRVTLGVSRHGRLRASCKHHVQVLVPFQTWALLR